MYSGTQRSQVQRARAGPMIPAATPPAVTQEIALARIEGSASSTAANRYICRLATA